jgi:hypothetical protein
MPSLKLKNVPDPITKNSDSFEVVDVSEWMGFDENNEPYTINVYPLTVAKKNILQRTVNTYEKALDKDGKPTTILVPNFKHDSACVIAALCSFDDEGRLVFGVDYADAVQRVESMLEGYRVMILTLSATAIKQTGSLNSKIAVEEAEKNSEPTP